ncbi:MAG: hypothetical protein ACE5GX_09665 [Thermoanaerobaculia bacterium]
MSGPLSNISWWRVILGGVGVLAASWATVFVVVTGYAARLGFKMRGAPPQEMISAFAERIGPTAGPIAALVLTLLVAYWVARKAAADPVINGLAVGVVVTVLSVAIGRSFSPRAVASWVLTLAVAGLGGWLAARRSSAG